MRHELFAVVVALVCQIGAAGAASASETINYNYDAKGRLISASHTGSANNGLIATYAYDAADNRAQVNTTGATPRVVVVPLNGFTVIPITHS